MDAVEVPGEAEAVAEVVGVAEKHVRVVKGERGVTRGEELLEGEDGGLREQQGGGEIDEAAPGGRGHEWARAGRVTGAGVMGIEGGHWTEKASPLKAVPRGVI